MEDVDRVVIGGGGSRMSGDDDPGGVVDPTGRVHGLDNVWVADTSICRHIPSRGTAATAVVIGERIAQLIGARS
jgi:choline dehydrogenase-like flavoprotein